MMFLPDSYLYLFLKLYRTCVEKSFKKVSKKRKLKQKLKNWRVLFYLQQVVEKLVEINLCVANLVQLIATTSSVNRFIPCLKDQ